MSQRVLLPGVGVVVLLLLLRIATTPLWGLVALGVSVALVFLVWMLARYTSEELGTRLVTLGVALSPIFSGPFAFSHNTVGDIFLALGFVFLIPTLLTRGLRLPVAYGLGLGVFAFASLLSFPYSEFVSVGIVRMIAMMANLALLPILFLWWAPSRRVIGRLAFAFVVGQAVSMLAPIGSGSLSTTRMQGLTTHPNAFGACCVFAIAMLAFLFFEWPPGRRWILSSLIVLNILGVVFSGSRAALIALAVLSLVIAFRERSTWLSYLYAVAFVALLATAPLLLQHLGSDSAVQRLLHPDDNSSAAGSNVAREALLSDGIKAFFQHPIVGSGYGGAETFFYHNVPLEMGVAAGVLGVVGWLLIQSATVTPVFGGTRFRLGYIGLVYLVTSQFSPSITVRWILVPLCLAMLGNQWRLDNVPDAVAGDGRGAGVPTPEGSLRAPVAAQRP